MSRGQILYNGVCMCVGVCVYELSEFVRVYNIDGDCDKSEIRIWSIWIAVVGYPYQGVLANLRC